MTEPQNTPIYDQVLADLGYPDNVPATWEATVALARTTTDP